MSHYGGADALSTPLISSRTLLSATAAASALTAPGSTAGRSRHYTAHGETGSSNSNGGATSMSGIPMSVGRMNATARLGEILATPSMSSRLPRPSSSGIDPIDAPPSTARRLASLKRTSSIAGLSSLGLTPRLDHYLDSDQIAALKRQLNRSQTELEEFRLAHSRLEFESSTLQQKLEAQIEEQAKRLDKITREKIVLLGLKRDLEEQSTRFDGEQERLRRDAEASEREVRKELRSVQQNLSEAQMKYRETKNTERQARESLKSAKDREEALEQEIERRGAALVNKETQLVEERSLRMQAERLAEQRKLATREASASSSNVVKEELHRQLSHLKAVEQENQRMSKRLATLEKQNVNVEVVKEANRSLENRVKSIDGYFNKIAQLESEVEMLKREKLEWAAFLSPSDTSEVSTPRKITRTLAATRIENAAFRQKAEEYDRGLQSRNNIIGQLEEELVEAQRKIEEREEAKSQADANVRQEKNHVRLLQQEIDLLKRHLESYDTEEAIQQAGNFDAQKTARVQELEKLHEAMKKEMDELVRQLEHWREIAERKDKDSVKDDVTIGVTSAPLKEQLRINAELREELDELKNSHELLEQELEALETQVDSLERDHGIKGTFNPETTRVLEYRDSPDRIEHAIRTSTLELLKSENSALVQRILDLSSTASSTSIPSQNLVPIESLKSAESTIASLRLKVQQKETMLKRISSAMAEKTESLRLAVQDLLGFQLAFLESGRIRITSLYAPSKDRSLAFDLWPGGPMPYKLVSASDEKVMKNEEVRRSVAFWLDNRRSLPGFLSSLTMTLYEESTRGAADGVVYG